ncbi:MAG: leucine-rich repeat protein [Ruminococcus sp.]|uniref:leucine-rich repeat protein n=1 Tax=Ruminococcus sp. TaxID=41978 RepID=UPI001B2BA424|nr:leucine-rich repeat protein [Ruminococcus sp.]MBO7473812.1 leucine-rich repeat protein [Ruminococcus sp.]
MKRKKISLSIAALIIAFSLSCMVTPNPDSLSSSVTPIIAAADSDYTYGSTDLFNYQKYSDHIVISSCKSMDMTSVEIPAKIDNLPVTEIGMYAFQLNTMKSLQLPDTLNVINPYAFGMCKNLTTLTIPDSVNKIGMHAFEECPALETINFPNHLVETGDYTFDNTPWLNAQRKIDPLVTVNGALIDGRTCKGEVVVPSSVKFIASGAFAKNNEITSAVIPANVSNIPDNLFWYCSNLASVELKGAETLGFGVFGTCNKLTDLKISGKLKKIDGYTFTDNTSTATITFYGSEATWKSVEKPESDAFLQRAKYIFDENHTEPIEVLRGDANCDGQIDLSDAVMIMQALANPNKYGLDGTAELHLTEQGKINGDMNGDGLTVGDALAIQNVLLGLGI